MAKLVVMTDEVRRALDDYMEIAGINQNELAEASGKHPQQISDALRGKIGKVSSVWEAAFAACGLKLAVVPEDADTLELVRKQALGVRGSDRKLRRVESNG